MVKKNEPLTCSKCGVEIPHGVLSEDHKNEGFVLNDKVLCKNCLVMSGGDPITAQSILNFRPDQDKSKPHDW
jgi:heterodisulfide reductase subunit A-like polyferredoxin